MNISSPKDITTIEEGITFLIMLGWKLVPPNLLLKPSTFKLDLSIEISKENNVFMFVDNPQQKFISFDTTTDININYDDRVLKIPPSSIAQVILENTDG